MHEATSAWVHTKTQAEARHGMVVARHPLAAAAGCEILQAGGNAIDAAAAASFANGVVQPVANTIGGGGYIVLRVADGRTHAIDYRYSAPGHSTSDMFEVGGPSPESDLFGYTGVRGQANEMGHLSVATPGSVAGLAMAIERFGRLSLGDVLAPAVRLAEEGFEMDWYGTMMQAIHLDLLTRFEHSASVFLREGGFPMRPRMIGPGDVHRQPALASVLREIAADGPDAFYRGTAAGSIEREMQTGDGILDTTDLAGYRPRLAEPPEMDLRGMRILGPLNMAIIVPLVRMLAHADLRHLAFDDPRRLHLLVEMLRLARADQLRAYGDEEYVRSSWATLSSVDHAAELIGAIDPERRSELADTVRSTADPRGEGTVHISVVDEEANAVSLTETILGNWGSGVTTDAGVLLNNGMVGFDPASGHPNSVGPGKRPVSFMSPLVVLDSDRKPLLSLGASGGRKIPAAVLQVLSNVLDLSMGIQQAVETPRVDLEGDAVLLDDRFPGSVERDLQAMGHQTVRRAEGLSTFEFANPCGIRISEDGSLHGGTNPYQQTAAIGY